MKNFLVLSLLMMVVSCTSEKINLSPVSSIFSSQDTKEESQTLEKKFDTASQRIFRSSEISNLISTFPKFKNDGVNLEVSKLKSYLKVYLQADADYNKSAKEKALNNFENSYKKIQRLRKFLNSDDDDVLNRYLVRIKTNMALLEQ